MSSNYKLYIEYLASFANSYAIAVDAETHIYPYFADLKRLIEHYQSTIKKFDNIQNELVKFIEKLNFDKGDFDYFQEKFLALRKLDRYLDELKNKQVPETISPDIQKFISNSYLSTSLYELELAEEQVLTAINQTYEATRVSKPSGCMSVIVMAIILAIILSFTF